MDKDQFEALAPQEQAKVFYQSSFQERGDLFPYCHQPDTLTRSLSPEELYLLTRELDREELTEVIRYANLEQLFFLSDIDCWKKDRVSGKRFAGWLHALIGAGSQNFVRWFEEMDYEMVVTGFKKMIKVVKPEWEYALDEVLGDSPYFTLDNMYYILVEEDDLATVKQAMEKIFEHHRGKYVALLEGILNEIEDEIEEEAYRRREMRLAEHGFPDPERARHIYYPISREDFEKFPLKQKTQHSEPAAIAHYPSAWSESRLFLDDALALLQEEGGEVLEGVREELMWLSNKVVACEGIDLSSEERVRRGVERARHMVNIGLEDLSGGDAGKACDILKHRWLEIIFRWGAGVLQGLRGEAWGIVSKYWKDDAKVCFDFLDAPYEGIFKGVLQGGGLRNFTPSGLPLYCEEEKGDLGFREFRSARDIEKIRPRVKEADLAHDFLMHHFATLFDRLHLEAKRGGMRGTLFSVCGTVFAWFALDGNISDRPLPEEKMRTFLEKGFTRDSGKRILTPGLAEKFMGHFFSVPGRKSLELFWGFVFSQLESELAGLDFRKKIEPRYISCLLLAK